jgi:tetratricopeptide (TPR) repeat protein
VVTLTRAGNTLPSVAGRAYRSPAAAGVKCKANRMRKITSFIVVLLLVGCATNVPSAQELNWSGNEAYFDKDYRRAIEWYSAALNESRRVGNLQYQAIAMYGLARSNGHLCNLEEAETFLKNSIDLRRDLPNVETANISQNLFELGRLYMAQREWDLASQQFSQALPMLQSFDMESIDPMGYVNLLEEYQVILLRTGKVEMANANQATISQLRSKNDGMAARYISEPYPANCPLNKSSKADAVTGAAS